MPRTFGDAQVHFRNFTACVEVIEEIHEITRIDRWFLHQIKMLCDQKYDVPILELKEKGETISAKSSNSFALADKPAYFTDAFKA